MFVRAFVLAYGRSCRYVRVCRCVYEILELIFEFYISVDVYVHSRCMVTDPKLKQNVLTAPVLLIIFLVGQILTSYTGLQLRQNCVYIYIYIILITNLFLFIKLAGEDN